MLQRTELKLRPVLQPLLADLLACDPDSSAALRPHATAILCKVCPSLLPLPASCCCCKLAMSWARQHSVLLRV